jgi:hypothetical protein
MEAASLAVSAPPTPLVISFQHLELRSNFTAFHRHLFARRVNIVISIPHMHNLTPPASLKRPHQSPEEVEPASKKARYNSPVSLSPPSSYWDRLSLIHLTKSALQELGRRVGPCPAQALDVSVDLGCTDGDEEGLKRFARHGGPDLRDLRGYPSPSLTMQAPSRRGSAASSRGRKRRHDGTEITTHSESKSQSRTRISESSGPYSQNFQQMLCDHNILDYHQSTLMKIPAPLNREELRILMDRERDSLSPSCFGQEEYETFEDQTAQAGRAKSESAADRLLMTIEGKPSYADGRSGSFPFRNLRALNNIANPVPGNPDIYYGAQPEQLWRSIRKDLSTLIEPSTDDSRPILPNFSIAVKGEAGTPAVANRQAAYYGALGARSMEALRQFAQPDEHHDGRTRAITSIYQSKVFQFYTCQVRTVNKHEQYSIHHLRTFALANGLEDLRNCTKAFRNLRDWAKEQRDTLIADANARVQGLPADVLSPDTLPSIETSLGGTELLSDPLSPQLSLPPVQTARKTRNAARSRKQAG